MLTLQGYVYSRPMWFIPTRKTNLIAAVTVLLTQTTLTPYELTSPVCKHADLWLNLSHHSDFYLTFTVNTSEYQSTSL